MNALVHLSEIDREELNWWMHQANLWNYRSLLTPPHTLGSLSGNNNWRTLVPNGNQLPHKLPGASGCLPSSSVFYKEPFSPIDHISTKGQHNSHSLSQSQGRNNTSTTVQPCQTGMGVVYVSEHHTSGQSLTRMPEYTSRQGITDWGWQIHPNIFQRINQKWGPLSVDLFTSRLTHQLSEYYSWRPNPYAKATDAFLQTWSGKMCYANPHAQDSLRNQSATSRGDPLVAPQSQPPPFQPQEVQLAVWPTSGDAPK